MRLLLHCQPQKKSVWTVTYSRSTTLKLRIWSSLSCSICQRQKTEDEDKRDHFVSCQNFALWLVCSLKMLKGRCCINNEALHYCCWTDHLFHDLSVFLVISTSIKITNFVKWFSKICQCIPIPHPRSYATTLSLFFCSCFNQFQTITRVNSSFTDWFTWLHGRKQSFYCITNW